MRKRFDRYTRLCVRDASALMNDPIPEIQPYYVSIKAKVWAGVEGARCRRYYIVTYEIERRKFSSIKTRLIIAYPATNASSPRHDSSPTREGGETKRSRGNHFVVLIEATNATTRVRHSRPADLRSGRAIIRDFLPAINVRHVDRKSVV